MMFLCKFCRRVRDKRYVLMQICRAEAQGMLKKFQAGGGEKGINAYRHLLEVLLRMRQTCCKYCHSGYIDLQPHCKLPETDRGFTQVTGNFAERNV